MLKRIWSILIFAVLIAPATALADTVGGIDKKTADETAQTLVQLFNSVLQPIGALLIFATIAFTAFKLIITAHKPEERAEAMKSIPYIIAGGIGLGAVMLLAGFVVGLMTQVSGN